MRPKAWSGMAVRSGWSSLLTSRTDCLHETSLLPCGHSFSTETTYCLCRIGIEFISCRVAEWSRRRRYRRPSAEKSLRRPALRSRAANGWVLCISGMRRQDRRNIRTLIPSLYTADAIESMVWHGGEIRLVVSSYVSDELPPRDFITSVRTLVFHGDNILLMQNRDRVHILPGGRVEPGETLQEALRREILEEAGIEIACSERLGFVHLRHETPRPPQYPYPYPDFFWLIYRSHYYEESIRNVSSASTIPRSGRRMITKSPLSSFPSRGPGVCGSDRANVPFSHRPYECGKGQVQA